MGACARRVDIATGYEGLLSGASHASNTYDAKRHNSQGSYYTIDEGFAALVHELELELDCRKRVKVMTHTLVRDVHTSTNTKRQTHEYRLVCSMSQRGPDRRLLEIRAKAVIVRAPPASVQNWQVCRSGSVRRSGRAVKTAPLNHVYGLVKGTVRTSSKGSIRPNMPRSKRARARYDHGETDADEADIVRDVVVRKCDAETLVAQAIPSTFRNDWHQLSYSSGNTARYWNRVSMQGRMLLLRELHLEFPN